MELELPSTRLVTAQTGAVLHVVADDFDVVGLGSNEMHQQRSNDGFHAGREHNDGDVVLNRPVIELFEVRIKFDGAEEQLDAFRERRLDTVQHLLERVPTNEYE